VRPPIPSRTRRQTSQKPRFSGAATSEPIAAHESEAALDSAMSNPMRLAILEDGTRDDPAETSKMSPAFLAQKRLVDFLCQPLERRRRRTIRAVHGTPLVVTGQPHGFNRTGRKTVTSGRYGASCGKNGTLPSQMSAKASIGALRPLQSLQSLNAECDGHGLLREISELPLNKMPRQS